MDNNIYSVLITALTVLGGASAWRFYEKRADRKEKDEGLSDTIVEIELQS